MRCSLCDAEVEFTCLVEADFAGLSEKHFLTVKHEPEDTGALCLACLLEHLKSRVTQAEVMEETDAIE